MNALPPHKADMLYAADIYKILRDEIIRGRLNPGERLIEKDLCERLGTTRGYVREALKLLRGDGFVILSHGKGATVAKISYQETKDLYELLAVLEAKSIELAAPHLDLSDIDKLVNINVNLKNCIQIVDRPTARRVWQEGNFQFHRCIAEKSGNRELQGMLENIRWRTFDFRYVYFFEPHFDFFCSQHYQLIEALKRRDPAKARQIMEFHVQKASEVALGNLENAPSLERNSVGRPLVAY
jgi:DNA-binding GntR family transcriptional regulator